MDDESFVGQDDANAGTAFALLLDCMRATAKTYAKRALRHC
jgi:hypothetical protein